MTDQIQKDKKYDFKLEYTLVAQTPLIHFQPGQAGATLRATEVKPKLDDFLKKRAGENGINLTGCFIKETDALDYKMRIVEKKRKNVVDLGPRTEFDIFYGNQKVEPGKVKKGILADLCLTVICFNSTLRQLIDRYVGEFFVATNFGTMSGKGFGSFSVMEKNYSESQIAEILKRECGAQKCYAFNGGPTPFKKIKTVYLVMKSGMSVPSKVPSMLFSYVGRKGLGNDKDGVKYKLISPNRAPGAAAGVHHYYVRALLGVGDRILYRQKNRPEITVSIKNKEKEIERLASPIFFKVIGNKVYVVACRIREEIYGKKFEFSGNNSRCEFAVPTKEQLGVDFIDSFMAKAVRDVSDNQSRALNDIKIWEVK